MGDGKRERPKHVNSGASHNWKINEHYFTNGEMTVEILHDDLTKSEALAIEPVSYTHLRAHETLMNLVCRLLLEKKRAHGVA